MSMQKCQPVSETHTLLLYTECIFFFEKSKPMNLFKMV